MHVHVVTIDWAMPVWQKPEDEVWVWVWAGAGRVGALVVCHARKSDPIPSPTSPPHRRMFALTSPSRWQVGLVGGYGGNGTVNFYRSVRPRSKAKKDTAGANGKCMFVNVCVYVSECVHVCVSVPGGFESLLDDEVQFTHLPWPNPNQSALSLQPWPHQRSLWVHLPPRVTRPLLSRRIAR